MKVTVPSGVPLDAVTVAVSVTVSPTVDGLDDDESAIEVAIFVAFKNTEKLPSVLFATAKSGLPSPLKSPTATETGWRPVA